MPKHGLAHAVAPITLRPTSTDPLELAITYLTEFAARLEAIGLLGSGTIGVQRLPIPGLQAVACAGIAQIILAPRVFTGGDWIRDRACVLHELLHLGQRPTASNGLTLLAEAVTTFSTVALLLQWYPDEVRSPRSLEALIDYEEAYAWPALTRLARRGGDTRNRFDLWRALQRLDGPTCSRVSRGLAQQLSPRAASDLWTMRRGARRHPETRRRCLTDNHDWCLHSDVDAFLALSRTRLLTGRAPARAAQRRCRALRAEAIRLFSARLDRP